MAKPESEGLMSGNGLTVRPPSSPPVSVLRLLSGTLLPFVRPWRLRNPFCVSENKSDEGEREEELAV